MCVFVRADTHLKDDHIVVAEGTEPGGPLRVVPDHLVNHILKVQRELLHTHTLSGTHDTQVRTHNHRHLPMIPTYQTYDTTFRATIMNLKT